MVTKPRCTRLLLICITAIGCNGSGDGGGVAAGGSAAACSAFKACGGNVVGAWNITGMCFDDPDALLPAREEPECKDLLRNVNAHVSGTYQFSADGHVSRDMTFSIDMDALWSAECLRAIANGPVDLAGTCTNLEANYAANPVFAAASCQVEGTDCSCMVTSVDHPSVATGNYTADGTALTDDEGPSDYCVAGDTLRIHAAGADGGGTLTLKR